MAKTRKEEAELDLTSKTEDSEPQAAELVKPESMPQEQPSGLQRYEAMVETALVNGAAVEVIERITALVREVRADQDRRDFNVAMNEAQAKIEPITRDAENQQTNSRYVRYETMGKIITPIYTALGFSVSHDEEDSPYEGQTRYVAIVRHRNGHSERYHKDLPIDDKGMKGTVNKTPLHGKASATTYARRLIEAGIFNVRFCNEDDDGNAAGAPETISDEQLAKIKEAFEFSGMPQGRLLKWGRVSKLEDLAAVDFDKAMQTISAFADRPGA